MQNPELERLAEELSAPRLAAFLEHASWRQYGGREGSYSKWRPLEGNVRIILPINPENDDYKELIREAIYRLAETLGDPLGVVRALDQRIRLDDSIKFRKDVPTVAGAVSWPIGHGIVQAAQEALLAAAKSRLARRAYYGNSGGQFAHRFLNSCLMGQTEVGSYVVTAFAPAREYFPEKETREDAPGLPVAGYTGRDISRSLVQALRATGDAVDHFAQFATMTAFEEGIRQGISREMASAVKSLIEGSNGAEISVEWSPSEDLPLPNENDGEVEIIQFEGSAVPILDKAIKRLTTMTPVEYVRVSGWVRVVARPKRGQPGIITITVTSGSEARTIKVRLNDGQFQIAAEAISQQQMLVVSGRQEREGRTHWLYNATDLQLLDARTSSWSSEQVGIPGA